LFALLGEKDRSLAPVAYSSFAVPGIDLRSLPVLVDPTVPSHQPFVIGEIDAQRFAMLVPSYASQLNMGAVPTTCDHGVSCFPKDGHNIYEIAGKIPVVNIHDATQTSPIGIAQEIIVGFLCDDVVRIATPYTCTSTSSSVGCVLIPTFIGTIQLPGPLTIPGQVRVMKGRDGRAHCRPLPQPPELGATGAVQVADFDGDGKLDIMATVSSTSADVVLAVAYGDGQGHFRDANGFPDQASVVEFQVNAGKTAAASGDIGRMSFPLAIGDLDGDGIVDFVARLTVDPNPMAPPSTTAQLGSGVLLTRMHSRHSYQLTLIDGPPPPELWDAAVITDFNRDGVNDVATHSQNDQGISFFLGYGDGTFSGGRAPTHFSVGSMRTGDFNGDLYSDVAFVEQGCLPSSTSAASLSVLFGGAQGPSSSVVSMGCLGHIQEIEPGYLDSTLGLVDRITDILAVSNTSSTGMGTANIAILVGTSDNQLIAPYLLHDPVTEVHHAPISVALGHFAAPDPAHPTPAGQPRPLDMIALSAGTRLEDPRLVADPTWWLIRGTGHGGFAPIDIYQGTAPDSYDYGSARVKLKDAKVIGGSEPCFSGALVDCLFWAPVVLAGNEYGSVVAVDSTDYCASRPSPQNRVLIFKQTVEGDHLQLGCIKSTFASDPGRVMMIDLPDVNGDGRRDLVVHFGQKISGFLQKADGSGFALDHELAIPFPPAKSAGSDWLPLAFTTFNPASASAANVMMATTHGLYASIIDASSTTFTTQTDPASLLQVAESDKFTSSKILATEFSWRIRARDMDLDGVPDLVLLENQRIHIFHGCSQRDTTCQGGQ
jgi:hypothetical protein